MTDVSSFSPFTILKCRQTREFIKTNKFRSASVSAARANLSYLDLEEIACIGELYPPHDQLFSLLAILFFCNHIKDIKNHGPLLTTIWYQQLHSRGHEN